MSSSANLSLKLGVVLQLNRIDLQRVVTLLVTADHRLPIETAQRAPRAQPKVVPCSLQDALLVDDTTRQRHADTDHSVLIMWFQR